MKYLYIILFISSLFCDFSYSQVKIWNKNLKVIKVKGIYSKLENPNYHDKDKVELLGATTVAGILMPYAIKYGNSALKKATSKNEENYQYESTSLNSQLIPYDSIINKNAKIKIGHYYYNRGSSKLNELSSYEFKFSNNENVLEVELDNIEETFTPVKMKKKYNFLMSSFKVSISAIINQQIDSTSSIRKSIALGDITINKVNPSFGQGKTEVINSGAILLPQKTEKNKKINIESLLVKITTNHINPYGSTSSNLNDFLEKNSETNESLLNTIFIKKVEE